MDQVLDAVKVTTPVSSDLAVQVSINTQKQIGEVVDRLIADRKHWEAHEFASSNQRKYGLLQSCHILYKSMAEIGRAHV